MGKKIIPDSWRKWQYKILKLTSISAYKCQKKKSWKENAVRQIKIIHREPVGDRLSDLKKR